jgi:hypothetical protein
VIQGVNGEDGATWLQGTNTPSPSEGNVGDFYLLTTYGFVYQKTSTTNWTYLMTLTVQGQRLIKTVNSDYEVKVTDDLIFVNAVSSDIQIVMPDTDLYGKEVTIKAVNLTKTVTIIPHSILNPGSRKIDGKSSYVFGTVGDSVTLCLRGTNWEII